MKKKSMAVLSLLCALHGFSNAEEQNARNDRSQNNVSVCIGNVLGSDKVQLVIYNNSKFTVRTSCFGTFGNVIHLKTPSGRVVNYITEDDLPENFIYSPDIVIKPSSTYTLENVKKTILALVVSGEKMKPGKYELWVDMVNWIDFKKDKYVKYTSNRFVFFITSKTKN